MSDPDRDSQILVLQPFYPSSSIHSLIAEIRYETQDDSLPSTSASIPWHISNKYYEADVYFKLSSLTLLDSASAGKTNTPVRTRRAAKMVSSRETNDTSKAQSDDDEELKRKVRNVFEALERPGGISLPCANSNNIDEEKMNGLQQEVDGVDAVMMVIDSNLSLSQHQHLLAMLNWNNGDTSILSGFDLAVSIVVALPSPLDEDTTASSPPPTMEQLSSLYTGKGWEFVDLDQGAALSENSLDDEGGEAASLNDEELHGVARIREALQTHTWPNLIRRDDRIARAQGRAAFKDDAMKISSEESLQQNLSSLPLKLDTLGIAATGAEPSKQDEELAEAFLKRIQASQNILESPREASGLSPKLLASLQQELKKFLEDEDREWPVSSQSRAKEGVDDEAWPTPKVETKTKAAFDDDFTEFVKGADTLIEGEFPNEDAIESNFFPDDATNNLDDAILMDILDKEMANGNSAGPLDKNYDFESTLSAVMAQAERVRSITDHDKRREEAARIALSISDLLSQ